MGYSDYSKKQLVDEVGVLQSRMEELEQANEELQQKDKYYKYLMETMSDGVVIEDQMNRIVYVNASFCETLGFSQEALVGRPTTDIIHPDGIELYLEQSGRRPNEQKASYEQKMRGAIGSTIPVIISVRALQNENGDYDGCLTVITDISIRKEAEDALRKNEEEFRNLFENAQVGVYRTSLDGSRYLMANQTLADMFGMSQDELMNFSPEATWADPADREKLIRQIKEKGVLKDFEIRGVNKSGEIITTLASIKFYPEQGYLEGISVDITERKRLEEALQESEEKYRTVVENSQASIYILDREGCFLFMNSMAASNLDGEPSEFVGRTLTELYPEELARHRMKNIEKVFEKQEGHFVEYRTEINGKSHWFQSRLQPLKDAQGQIYAVLGITNDITEQKQAEIQLRESEERYRTLVEGAGFPIFVLDREGKFQYINWIAAAGLKGYPKDFVGKTMWEVFAKPEADYQMRIVEQVFKTGEGMEVESISSGQKVQRWFHTSITPVKNTAGEVESVIGIAVDITEQKKAQEVLQRDRDELEKIVAERTKDLLEANLRLQREITEKEQAQQALVMSEEKYRTLVELFPDAVVILQDGRHQYASPAFRELFGYTQEDVEQGLSFDKLIQEKDKEVARQRYEDRLAGKEQPVNYIIDLRGKDGRIVPCETSGTLIEYQGRPAVLLLLRDISNRRQAEKLKQIQHDLVINLAGKRDLGESLESIMMTVLQLEGFDAGGAYLIDEEAGGMDLITHQGLTQRFVEQVSHYEPDDSRLQLIRQGKPVYLSAPEFPAEMVQDLKGENILSLAVIPIWFREKVIGCLNLASHSNDVITEENRRMVESIAETQLGVLIAQIRSEEALRESEATARALLNAPTDVILLLDTNGDIVDANETLAEKLNIKQEQLIGANIEKLFPGDVVEHRRTFFQQVLDTAQPVRFEAEHQGRWNDNVLYPIMDAKGTLQKIAVISRDITKRKQQEEELRRYREDLEELVAERTAELRKSEEKYRQVVDNSHDIIYAMSPEGILTFISPQALKMGFTEDEIVGHHISEFIHPDDIASVMKDFTYTIETGATPVTEFRMRKKDGSYIYAEETGEVVYEADQIKQIVGSIRDITERVKAEQELRFQAMLLGQIKDRITATDLDGIITYVNQAECDSHKRSREELLGQSVEIFGEDPAYGATQQEIVAATRAQGEWRGEVVNFDWEGNRIVMDCHTWMIRDDQGLATGLCGIATNITEQKKAEERLRNSEQRFRMVFDHVTVGILLSEPGSKKLFAANDMICQMLDYTKAEIKNLYLMDIHPLKAITRMLELFEHCIENKTFQSSGIPMKRKDGSIFYTDVNTTHIRLEGKLYIMGVFRDITERLEAEARLQQYRNKMVRTERLASLGLMGANLMHRLNQPFTVIRLMLEDCQVELSNIRIPGRVEDNLNDGLSAISQAEEIVKEIKLVAPRMKVHEEEIELGKIAHQVIQILSDSARRSKLQLILEGMEQISKTIGNPSDLEQIFFNLIENAIHAADDQVEQHLKIQAVQRDQLLELEFSDNCGGIDPEYQGKIFDTFFTTKTHGTGLGLAIIEQIITDRGGKIRAESQKGKGTTFYISLPWIL